MNYYWLSSYIIEDDSIIGSGNWYRIIKQTHGHLWALLEETYERVRLVKFSTLPSREKALFLFTHIDDARNLQQQRPIDILYEVQVINSTDNSAILDMAVVNPSLPDGRLLTIQELELQAENYWNSASLAEHSIPEILIEGCVRIVKRIS
jgi:hypothetical protein